MGEAATPTIGRPAPGLVSGLRTTARRRPGLAVFMFAYLAGFTIVGLAVGSSLAIPYLVLVAGLAVFVVRLDHRFDLGDPVLWALAVWGCLHMAGGVLPLDDDRVLYNAVLGVDLIRYDRLVHAFGFGAATAACGRVLRWWLPDGRFGAAAATLTVLAGMGVGAINEVVEFVATLVLPETNVGGYTNTGWDLVFDLAGALAVGGWLWWTSRRPPGPITTTGT